MEWGSASRAASAPAIGGKRGREKPREPVAALAEHGRQSDPAADDRQGRQHDERHGHGGRRFVQVVFLVGRAAEAPEERERYQPEHVERRQARREEADRPQHSGKPGARVEDRGQDGVFGEEARERRDSRDRQGRGQERPERDRQLRLEAAHPAHVLLAAHRMDHRAGPQEETGLEERVRHDVEHARHVGADAAGQEHVAQLRDRGIGEDLLDVVLGHGDRAGEDRGEGADDRDHEHRLGRQAEEDVAAGHHVDAGGDHRGRVDQRGDRRGTGHRVRKPDVQGNLGALADRADEETQADERQRRRELRGRLRRLGEHLGVVEAPERGEDAEHPEQEPVVADAVDDERLLARRGGVLPVEVVADEQVGAQAHALPPDEHEQEALRQDEREHREQEQVQVGEVPRIARVRLVVAHVADRVDVDQETDERDEGQHQRGERVEPERQVDRQRAREDPAPVRLDEGRSGSREVRDQPAIRGDGRQRRGSGSHGRDEGLAQPLPEEAVEDEPQQGNRRNDPERDHRLSRLTTSGGGSC